MTRRTALLSVLPLGTATAAYARFVEPVWLKTTYRQVQLPGLTQVQPIRLVHLADLHASGCVPNSLIEHAIELTLAQKPDLVCITGDFVTSPRGGYDGKWYRRTLEVLPKRVPTYATMGNHDGGSWSSQWKAHNSSAPIRDLVGSSGVDVVHNQQRLVTVRDQELRLVGLGDLWAMEMEPLKAFGRLHETYPGPTILMSHNPDSKSEVGRFQWELMLSGHTHGGQVVMPVTGLSPAPVNDRRYIYGLLPWRDRQIHITSGVGNAQGVRFNCRPEISVLDLVPQRDETNA